MPQESSLRIVSVFLWITAAALLIWVWNTAGIRHGLGQVLPRWSLLGLPLFCATAFLRYRSLVWRQAAEVWAPLLLWVGLLALSLIDAARLDAVTTPWAQAVGEAFVFLVLVFPFAILVAGFRLAMGIGVLTDHSPNRAA